MKKPFREVLLHTLLDISYDDMIKILDKETKPRSGFPIFFYRYPFFSNKMCHSGHCLSDSISLQSSMKLSYEHILFIEFLFSFLSKKKNHLHFKVPVSLILDRFGQEGVSLFGELEKMRITIREGEYTKKSFQLINYLHFDAKEGFYCVVFSDEVSLIYLLDYLFPLQGNTKVLSLFDHENSGIFIRYLFSLPLGSTNGIGMDLVSKRVGLSWSGHDISTIGREVTKYAKDLQEVGIHYEMLSRKILYNTNRYPQFTPPAYKFSDIDEVQNEKTSTDEYINFHTIELTQQLVNKALSLGFKQESVSDLFTIFKNSYSQSTQQYKSLIRTWTNFLKKQSGYNQSRKIENSGDASTIVYNKDMKEVSERYALNEVAAFDLFTLFSNHYNSEKLKKSNWVPMWENWIIRNKQRQAKDLTADRSVKGHFENQFYLAQLVSESIKDRIKELGIPISDIISGKQSIKGIIFKSWALPPSMGKGKETIFSWEDPKEQFQAISGYLPKDAILDSSIPISKPKTKELSYHG